MKSIVKNEKGFTLIEVIASLAILMIIMVGIAGIVTSVLNSKKFIEQKQEATLLGQEIMEEILLIDELIQVEGAYQIPLAGRNNLINTSDNEIKTLEGTYVTDINGYDITLQMQKSTTSTPRSEVNPILQANSETKKVPVIEISSSVNNITITELENSTALSLSFNKPLKIEYSSKKITIQANTSLVLNDVETPELMIRLAQNFNLNEALEIEVTNKDSIQPFEVSVQRYSETKGKVNFDQNKQSGLVKIINNQILDLSEKGELYNFTLTIRLKNKELFKTYGNRNFMMR